MANKLTRAFDLLAEIARLPVARLQFRVELNPDEVRETYRHFTRRHPRYKLIRNKALGAALVALPGLASPQDYLARVKQAAGYARRAQKKGYTVRAIDKNELVDEIHEVNTSLEMRQGQPMDAAYLRKLTAFPHQPNFRHYGVFSAQGKLVAYGDIALYGNFAAFHRVIGVRNNDGIMHFMVCHIVGDMIAQGDLDYVMYDTFFGASPGLKAFKTMLGFKPYRAKYSIQ